MQRKNGQQYEMINLNNSDSISEISSSSLDNHEKDISVIPVTDDPNSPSLTFRALVLGTLWCVLLGIPNSILAFRTSTFVIPTFIATLLSYPMGIAMAEWLPYKTIDCKILKFNLNSGPFSIKEHVLIAIIAGAGGNIAYGIDNVVAQKSILFMVKYY